MQLQSKQQKEKNHEKSPSLSLSKEALQPISRKNLSVTDKMDLLTACIERIKSSKDAKNIKKSSDSKHNHEIKPKSNNKTEALVDKNVKEKKKRGRKKKIP